MICTECSKKIRPVVAIDIDGTIADYHGHFFQFAESWLGIHSTGWSMKYHGKQEISHFMELDKRTYRQIKLAYRQGGMKRSMPCNFGVTQLFRMLRAQNVEIWMTTTRPYLQIGNIDEDTREWLRRNGIPYDYLLYDENKYESLIQHVDHDRVVVVLEDQLGEYHKAKSFGLNVILLRNSYNMEAIDSSTCREVDIAFSIQNAITLIEQHINMWSKANGNS